MQKYKAELLAAAWRELDQIADIHMALVGAKSAENESAEKPLIACKVF